jgi:hypothetical protein
MTPITYQQCQYSPRYDTSKLTHKKSGSGKKKKKKKKKVPLGPDSANPIGVITPFLLVNYINLRVFSGVFMAKIDIFGVFLI